MTKKDEKARVRVFFGEIEGDNETIRDGLRSIAQAVNRTFQPETRFIKVIGTGENADSKQITEDFEREIINAELSAEHAAGDEDGDRVVQKAKPKAPRKSKRYDLINDLNLRPDGKQTFRDFYRLKQPSGNQEVVTVAVYYLQKIVGVSNISVNHVYTSIKELSDQGVRLPANIETTLSDIVRRKAWIESSDSNGWVVTVRGENFIEQDLISGKDNNGS